MGELETYLLDVLLDITLEGSHEGRDAFVVINLERERGRGNEGMMYILDITTSATVRYMYECIALPSHDPSKIQASAIGMYQMALKETRTYAAVHMEYVHTAIS